MAAVAADRRDLAGLDGLDAEWLAEETLDAIVARVKEGAAAMIASIGTSANLP